MPDDGVAMHSPPSMGTYYMDLHLFLNRVRTLHCLDFFDLIQAGCLERNDPRWGAFRSDPVGFLLRVDDETAEKIWAICEKRASHH
jgi:hypothetical protein